MIERELLSSSMHQHVFTGSYSSARLARPAGLLVSQQSISATLTDNRERSAALSPSSFGALSLSGWRLFQQNAAQEAFIRDLLTKSHQSKRNLLNHLVARVLELSKHDRATDLGPVAGRRHMVKRKISKEQKKVNNAKKLLNDDLRSEKKDQDKAAANALKGVSKAQSAAEKEVAHEDDNRRKFRGEDQRKIDKAKADLMKVADDRGKPGNAGKSYAKALANEQNAENDMAKLIAKGDAAMAKINNEENNSLTRAGENLKMGERKAHTDQFGDKGARLAKEHPSAWQKFKHAMSKIVGPIEWAISGLSLLIPGAEEFGLARLAAKAAEMIAEKVTKKGIEKGAEKGMKKGTELAVEQKLAITAAQSESDAQIAAAKANEQKGLDQFQNAVTHVARPAAGRQKRHMRWTLVS